MGQQDLISEAFKYLNGYKRARALEQIERDKGETQRTVFRRVEQYELIDKLELTLRAIQRQIREEPK
jgi:hypothetical protein